MKRAPLLLSAAILLPFLAFSTSWGSAAPAAASTEREFNLKEKKILERAGSNFRAHQAAKDVRSAYRAAGRYLVYPKSTWFEFYPPTANGSPLPPIKPAEIDPFLNGHFRFGTEVKDIPLLEKNPPLDKAPILVAKVGEELFFQILQIHDTTEEKVFEFVPLARARLTKKGTDETPKTADAFKRKPDDFDIHSSKIYPGFFSNTIIYNLDDGNLKELTPVEIASQLVNFAKPFLEKHGVDSNHGFNTENTWNAPPHNNNEGENIQKAFYGDFKKLTWLFLNLFTKAEGEEDEKGEKLFPIINMLPKEFKKAYKWYLYKSKDAKEHYFKTSVFSTRKALEKSALGSDELETYEEGEVGPAMNWLKKKIEATPAFQGL